MGELLTREQWGAREPKAVHPRDMDEVTAWVFHEADAAARGMDVLSEEELVRAIQAFHMDERDWDDVGYHYMIGNSGNVYQGRHPDWIGAHCAGFNTPSLGICFLTDGGITLAAGAAAASLVRTSEFVVLHRQLDVFAHREKVQTGCPGDALFGWVEQVRRPGDALGRR